MTYDIYQPAQSELSRLSCYMEQSRDIEIRIME